VEIVVVDGVRRFGNGLPLPAGPMREMPGRLGEVDAVVVNGGVHGPHEFGMVLSGTMFHNVHDEALTHRASDWVGKTVHGVAGIGNPDRFFDKLRSLGMGVIEHPFPDHHAFVPEDILFGNEEVVLMTEKDAVKCKEFAPANCWFLPVDGELDPAFGNLILEKLNHGN
jgi:tetraacyldisaccharide 4'-kinase